MSEQLSTALVTGGSRGIGKAIAETLAKAGYQVYLTYVSKADEAEAVAWNIVAAGGKACAFRLDVADAEAVAAFFKERIKDQVELDVLVNNAGILSLKKPFVEYTKADWDKIFGINFMGDVFFCKALIPTMKEKKSGRIINMASQSAETGGLAASPIYAASKAAVWCMTKSLAGEMGPYQVTVNAVAPGYIMTEMTRNAGYRDDMVPMKRLGTPEDVADVVGFLASEDSRYVTGMIVDINGGTVMR